MSDDQSTCCPTSPDRLAVAGLGGVRELLTAPGLVGFQIDARGLRQTASAKAGKSQQPPPPPPAPPRL